VWRTQGFHAAELQHLGTAGSIFVIKTSCNILTGFLGSGKTTLLRYVLRHGLQNKRVAVIMNEIGDIGIDGKVITGLEGVEQMVELNSGCICCTIEDYRFAAALQEIITQTKPELLIIETTGLADPTSITARLVSAGVARDAVITMVDASTFPRLAAAHCTLADQVKVADFLVLNKLDLVTDQERRKVEKRLRRLNRRALLLQATHGQVATELLFGTGVSAYRARLKDPPEPAVAPVSSHSHGRDTIQSFAYESSQPVELQAFERFLKKLPANVYRAKGLLRLPGGAFPHLFNFTCGRFDFHPLSPDLGGRFPTQAVFIGQGILAIRDRIVRKFRACERSEDTTA
jgi:G3E family GTPase